MIARFVGFEGYARQSGRNRRLRWPPAGLPDAGGPARPSAGRATAPASGASHIARGDVGTLDRPGACAPMPPALAPPPRSSHAVRTGGAEHGVRQGADSSADTTAGQADRRSRSMVKTARMDEFSTSARADRVARPV
ncbi:hypothetical protein GCM10010343_16800 [Streptomyces avidinii]|nr:hypothetical protein GCM10010343_16800 [Streptomyces avidinii]